MAHWCFRDLDQTYSILYNTADSTTSSSLEFSFLDMDKKTYKNIKLFFFFDFLNVFISGFNDLFIFELFGVQFVRQIL